VVYPYLKARGFLLSYSDMDKVCFFWNNRLYRIRI